MPAIETSAPSAINRTECFVGGQERKRRRSQLGSRQAAEAQAALAQFRRRAAGHPGGTCVAIASEFAGELSPIPFGLRPRVGRKAQKFAPGMRRDVSLAAV
jgi:hypothetical protein